MSFVDSTRVERIQLSSDRWIEIKRELNTGERRKMFARQIKGYGDNGRAVYDPENLSFARVSAYLLNWSLQQHGKPVPVSDSAIDALDEPTFADIVDAIDRHELALEKERQARKNAPAGEKNSAAISPSAE